MASSNGSKRVSSLAAGAIIGLILGALVGYSFGSMGDRSQIVSLQRQISDLQGQLANKNAQISSLEKQNTDLQQQISNYRVSWKARMR